MANTPAKSYQQLLTDLKQILETGKKRAQNAAQQIVVETYWQMGQRIAKEGELGDGSLAQLARDLGFEKSLVARVVKFYKMWPNRCPVAPQGNVLTWSHFREVLAIEDKSEREFYLQKASDEQWSKAQLAAKIKNGYYEDVLAESKLPAKKKSRAPKLKPITQPLYTYAAKVERIVDGDTLVLMIDLGFDVWKKERVRLRGLDCPELNTKEGAEARDYVAARLTKCPVVVVRSTRQIDIYGRFVVDVFYLEEEADKYFILEKGKYLNAELLEKGMAVRM